MDKPGTSAESIFAQAIELPKGIARDQFVKGQCAGQPTLLAEVQACVRAHEKAVGSFAADFDTVADAKKRSRGISPNATAVLNAAAHAEAFLRHAGDADEARVQKFLATLPDAIQTEACERIEAALHVREMHLPSKQAQGAQEVVPKLPGFRIEHKLGAGGLGTVYAAHDEKLNRRVAIKIIHPREDEQVRRRLLDEARASAAVNDPSIVTIYSVLDDTDPPAIVMKLVEGFPLDRFAAQLSFEQKARLLREVARGLTVAHARGLIHRDLKPDNIIVGPDMQPCILDFGLALTLEEASRQERGFEGTPRYASPEQALGKSLTPASDVFSFGSLMFKVLTGKPPFPGESATQILEAIATTSPPFLREAAVGVPEDLQAVCLACLAWNPDDRPSAERVTLEHGRFLVGEPVRLKPKLYDDLLRRNISEHSAQAQAWESQSIISREEHDALEIVHRRLLADEDHWIVDARRITPLQTVLSTATWLTVAATVLTVLFRDEMQPPWQWLLPACLTGVLLLAGLVAWREGENLSAATFLAGATLAIAPCMLALLAELSLFATPSENVSQLFGETFTNQQAFLASFFALVISALSLWRLKMTGFAWTTAILGAASYMSLLLLFNFLEQKPEIQALWCLPLAATESIAVALERAGRVRWTLPFHLVSRIALVVGLDVLALNGPTLKMIGIDAAQGPYFDDDRLKAFSVVLNGAIFLTMMLLTEKSRSLDWRRASKLLEILAIVHTLSALFGNSLDHRDKPFVEADVWLYIGAAVLYVVLAPIRSRWRMLVGGLAGCGLGAWLLVDLGLVARQQFIIGLGIAAIVVALATFAYVRRSPRFVLRTILKRPNGKP